MARRFALVPLGPPLLAYKSNCKAMLTAVNDAVELVVDRPYKAGEPVVVWYHIILHCKSCLLCWWLLLHPWFTHGFRQALLHVHVQYIMLDASSFVDCIGVDHNQIQGCFSIMVLSMKIIHMTV